MKTTKASQQETAHQPTARQAKSATRESPQGGQLAQLADTANNSPAMAAQRKLIESIHNSPRQAAQHQQIGPRSGVVQKITIGKDEIRTVAALAGKLNISEDDVLSKFNTALAGFPPVDKSMLNTYLNGRNRKVSGAYANQPDQFLGRLAEIYKATYFKHKSPDFAQSLEGIKKDQEYKTLMNPEGINYAEGVDDGAAVKDEYDKTLACSLYALLALRPNFLGAANPKQLHYILRANPKTRLYDNDANVGQIRIAAGLKYKQPGVQNTVGKLINKLNEDEANRAKKFIIDPSGAAHTFTLVFSGGQWKQFDNDNVDGIAPTGSMGIKLIWSV